MKNTLIFIALVSAQALAGGRARATNDNVPTNYTYVVGSDGSNTSPNSVKTNVLDAGVALINGQLQVLGPIIGPSGTQIASTGTITSGSGAIRLSDNNTNAGLFSGSSGGGTVNSAGVRGDVTNSAGNCAVSISNVTTLSAGTDRYAACFYNDAVSTLKAKVTSNGTFVGNAFNSNSSNQTFGSWTGNTVGVVGTGTSFLGGFKATSAVTFGNITCSWAVAGLTGTVGVVVRVRNITDGSTLCTCTLGACTATAAVPLSCGCNTAALAGKQYTIQYDSTAITGTDCGTDPSGTMCTVELLQ